MRRAANASPRASRACGNFARSALGAALLALVSCGRGDPGGEPAQPEVQPIGDVEAARGQRACESLAERACAGADGDPSRSEECALARARPQALEMNLRVARARDSNLSPRDLSGVIAETRKIAAGCLEDLARLR